MPGAVGTYTAPWTHWYLHYALGRAEELGFAVDPIRKKTDQFVIGMINNSGHPQLLAHYELPVGDCTNSRGPAAPHRPRFCRAGPRSSPR